MSCPLIWSDPKTLMTGIFPIFFFYFLTLIITPLSDSGKPSKQQLALQMELRMLQSARSLDEEEFDNQKQVLQAQLQSEVSHIAASECGKICAKLLFLTYFSHAV